MLVKRLLSLIFGIYDPKGFKDKEILYIMPFRVYRRRPVRRYKRKAPVYRKKALRTTIKRVLKSQIEHKYWYYNSQQSVRTLTSVPILNPSQGDAYNARTGDSITPSSITGSISVQRQAGATAGTLTNVRVLIIRWRPDTAVETPLLLPTFYRRRCHCSSHYYEEVAR